MSPGCNRCGDGFNAPADCGRSEVEAAACRGRVERHRVVCLARYLAGLPSHADRRERFAGMAAKGKSQAFLEALRAQVWALMRSDAHLTMAVAGNG